MDTKAYIASGILELYVAGQLSEKENLEVAEYAETYPEIKNEISEIEAAVLALSEAAAPNKPLSFEAVKNRVELSGDTKLIPLNRGRNRWLPYVGWAASAALLAGLGYFYNQNNQLRSDIKLAETEIQALEEQIAGASDSLEKTTALLQTLRDKNVTVIPLGGQVAAPEAYAKAYWNETEKQLFIDAQGLPEPPDGMDYQVWSLTLNPLTPTSVGLLENFQTDENGVFALSNPNQSQAFGITLEPAGGSESPNLEQLYVLGTVSS